MIGGKVLDPSALAEYVHGSIAMDSWLDTARKRGVVLFLPDLALAEVVAVYPDADLTEVLGNPQVIHGDLNPADAVQVARLLRESRVFDATAGHVVLVARQRRWSVLTADPGRVLRVAPDLDVDEL